MATSGGAHPCGGTEDWVWVQVVSFDTTDTSTACPTPWQEMTPDNLRLCGHMNSAGTFRRFTPVFPFSGGSTSFSKVCGRVKSYSAGVPNAFEKAPPDAALTDILVTGLVPATSDGEHLWTFAAGSGERRDGMPEVEFDIQCPCDRMDPSDIRVPDIVGNNYFCEAPRNVFTSGPSSFFLDNPLWDGLNCTPELLYLQSASILCQ